MTDEILEQRQHEKSDLHENTEQIYKDGSTLRGKNLNTKRKNDSLEKRFHVYFFIMH